MKTINLMPAHIFKYNYCLFVICLNYNFFCIFVLCSV